MSTWRKRRLEPEADVRHAEDRRDTRELGLDAADRLDRLHAVAAEVLLTRAQREREHVEDEVGGLEPVLVDGEIVDAPAHAELPVGGARLALLVDREADHRGAVLPREREHPVEARARPFAVLEVGRVEERLAAGVLEAGLEDLGLRGVEHEGERCLRREATGELVHVGDTVATDVVDAHVEDVRALLHLLARHLHARVPIGFEHRVTELP